MMAKRNRGFTRCLSALLAAGMLAGMMPAAAWAEDFDPADTAAQTETATPETAQPTPTPEPTAAPTATPAAEAQDETPDDEQTDDEATLTVSADDFVSYGTDEAALYSAQMMKVGAAVQNTPEISVAKLPLDTTTNQVFGEGILTGTGAEFDTETWDKQSANRGCDSGPNNDVVRSFDSVIYTVTTTVINLDTTSDTHTLTYAFTLPTDTELKMSTSTDPNLQSFTETPNADNTTTYAYTFNVSTDNCVGGEVNRSFPLNVGNKHNGDSFKPEITVYLDNDENTKKTVENNQEIYVTSVPAYNIVLDKNTSISTDRGIHDFSVSKTESCKKLAETFGYTDNKVDGYRQFYGFALEMAHPDRGIRGTEFPDLTKDITFDIDISGYTVKSPDGTTKNVTTEGFVPLLYEINPNEGGGANIGRIPYTKSYTDAEGIQWGCYDCGDVKNVKIEQDTADPTTLHVTLPANTIHIDITKFPQKNNAGETYWATLDKIMRGVFASWSFTVIYPYKNAKGKTLMDNDLLPNGGGIAVKAVAENMNIKSSVDGAEVTEETNTNDNTAERTWSLASKGSREHGIFYSNQEKFDESYSVGSKESDSDVAAVGANDLAFTVLYSQTQVGGAYPENTPKHLEQLALFDSSAIQNVQLSRSNATALDYTLTLKYARYKGDALNNDTMRTADKTDFDFYGSVDEIPDGRYDGVLLVYDGKIPDNITTMNLTAQCTAQVNPDATNDRVYMITLVTFNGTTQTGEAMDDIDHRNVYDITVYKDGQYSAGGEGHRFSTAYADGLYIVPYLAGVEKNVAQKKADGSDYSDYDINYGQRYVDYCIAPRFNYKTKVNLPEGANTTVTLVDTLPEGMAYIDGSARWGGSYTDLGPTMSAIITGGEAIEPVKSVNDDGLIVLTWTIENVPLDQEKVLPKLYYSCKLGDENDPDKDQKLDYTNGLTNFVGIHTNEDKRPFNLDSGNYSQAKVTPYKANQFFISKHGEPWKELNDSAYYDLTVSNTSTQDKEHLAVVDAMPYDSKNNTTKKGSYKLKSLTLNLKALGGKEVNDFQVWYTEDSSKAGLVSTAFNKDELTQADSVWKRLEYKIVTNENGIEMAKFTLPEGGAWPTAIVYWDDNLKAQTVARLHMEFDIVGAVGDDLVNVMTTKSNDKDIPATAETRIVSRTLEGTVWYDKDQDGKIGAGEERLPGVKATLLHKNEKTGKWEEAQLFTDPVTGQLYPSTVTTDENGHYKFVGLPEGEYRVAFTDENGNVLGQYDAETKFDASADGSKVKNDNDSVTKNRDNKLKSGTINDIEKAPTLDEIAGGQYSGGWEKTGDADYNMPNQNFGVIKNSDTPKEPENPDEPKNSPTPEPIVTPKPDKPGEPTPTPEHPGTPTPTPAAPTATPGTPTATPKPGTPSSPVTPANPTKPATPAQSTATPSPAPTATPQAAKATATPAPAATTSAIPQTSDPLPVGMLLALVVLSLGSAAALTVRKRRK